MVYKSCKSKKLNLCEIDKKTLELKKIREIFTDKKVIHRTIIFYQNKLWFFCISSDEANSHLNVAFVDSLFSDFDHPENPVKIDQTSAILVGTPFILDGRICQRNRS